MKILNTVSIPLIGSLLYSAKASNEISLDTDRDLQTVCSISATVKCMIVSAGVSCDMFRIFAHQCRTETVEMTYEWCNKNANQIVQLDGTATKIDLNDVPFSMNKRDIPENTCRKHVRKRDFDLCDPKYAQIYGSITINGWSNPTQIGYTCYAHQYIQTRIVYPSPITRSPTTSPTSEDEIVVSYDLEKIQVDPIVNCKIAGTKDACADYMAGITSGDPMCNVDLIWEYRITNVGMNCGNITSIQATQDEQPLPDIVLDSLTVDEKEMCPGESLVVGHPVAGVNLCDLFGREIVFDVAVNGGGEGLEALGLITFPIGNRITAAPHPITNEPTTSPSSLPSPTLSSAPSPAPSSAPSPVPTQATSLSPSKVPSPSPSSALSSVPSPSPSSSPSSAPSPALSSVPSPSPSSALSSVPSPVLSSSPSSALSSAPSPARSSVPSPSPPLALSSVPSPAPSTSLSSVPSPSPSSAPSPAPVSSPVVITKLEKIQVDPIVNCKIAGTKDACADYMAGITSGDPMCNVDLIWEYRITNVGTNCGNITSIQATQDEQPLPDIVLDSLTVDEKEMCPGESLVVGHPVVGVNLCDYFGSEILFMVAVNGGGLGLEGYGFVAFPSKMNLFPPITNEPTSSPIQLEPLEMIQMERVVICKIDGSQGHMCSDYMQNITPGQQSCEVAIIWEYRITNEGTACGEIYSIQATLDNEILPPLVLTAEQKEICPGEILIVDHPVDSVNLCNVFGTELIFVVEVNGGGNGLVGEGFVSFPIANQITLAPSPLSAPTDIHVAAPVAPPVSVGEILTYEIISIDCIVKSVVPNIYCSDYLNSFDLSDSSACNVDIQYDITVENIGANCKVLKQIETIVDGKNLAVDISAWSYNRRNFCRSENFDIRREESNVDICSFPGNDIPVTTSLDKIIETGFLSFPLPPEYLKFSYEIDLVDCEVVSNGLKIGCTDYLGDIPYISSPQGHFHTDCFIPIQYTFHVRHTGTKCEVIEKIDTFVDGIQITVSTSDWPFSLKEFCPMDNNLEIYRTEEPFNICHFAGREIDVSINIVDVVRETFLEFPVPNNVPSPTPPTKVENETNETVCTSSPTEIWFQLNRRSCAASENQQGIGRRRKLILLDKFTRDLKSKGGTSISSSKKGSSYKSYKSSSTSLISLSNTGGSKKLRPSISKGDVINPLGSASKGGKGGSSKGGKGGSSKGGKGDSIEEATEILSKGGKGGSNKGGKGGSSKGGKGGSIEEATLILSKGGKGGSSKGGGTFSPPSMPPVEVTGNNIYVPEINRECKDHCMDIEFPAYIQIYSMDKSKMFFDGEVTENEIFKIGPCEIPDALTVAIYKMENGIKTIVQELSFNTSCKDPTFQLGDTFGGLKIYGFTNEPQNTVMMK